MTDVTDGNLYPVSSEHFEPLSEPPEQVKEKDDEEQQIISALPLIKELLVRFEDRIAKYSSIKGIEVDLGEDPELHQKKMWCANQLVETYEAEKAYLEDVISEYLKK